MGADLNIVKQRNFEQQFGLRDYETVTGHLTAYVETGIEDVLAQVSASSPPRPAATCTWPGRR